MWEKCQIFDPDPTSTPSSITAVGWMKTGTLFVLSAVDAANSFKTILLPPRSSEAPGEATGHIWLTGPHVSYRNQLRKWIKKETGIDIERSFPK